MGALALAMGLGGCGPDTPIAPLMFGFTDGYAQAPEGAPVLLSNAAWWYGLDDEVLNRLISLGLRDSLSLEMARERVVAARALREAVPGAALLSPSAGVRAEGTENSGPDIRSTASLGLTWMLDPYGARREELAAAEANINAAGAEADAAQLLVLYNMANAYTTLRHAQAQLALTRRELATRQTTLGLTRTLVAADQGTLLEVTRSQARVAEIRARLPGLEAAIEVQINQIALLAGAQPGQIAPELTVQLRNGTHQPHPNMTPDVGIPADLLRNRPDIRIAEARYYAAVAQVGVARANLYPRLSLSGAISINALNRSPSAVEAFFGPSVQFPSLPLGSARAAVEARHAQAREAHLAWKETVLTAIHEVENALIEYRASTAAVSQARQARTLYAQTLTLTRQVFRSGEATLSDLVLAEQALASSDQALAELERDVALRFIDLNVRLGAGNSAARLGGGQE